MALGLGISAFVVLLLLIPVPIVGSYITFLALVLAAGAALAGDKGLTIATTVLSGLKLFLFSPTWHIAMFGGAYMQATNAALANSPYADASSRALMTNGANNVSNANHVTIAVTLAFLAAPIGALLLRQMGGSSKAASSAPKHF